MTIARYKQIDTAFTLFYHCINRCVRRGFLLGIDHATGKNYEHRKPWIIKRFKQLCSIFLIDCLAFSIMTNHYHLILKVDIKQAGGVLVFVAKVYHNNDDELLNFVVESE